MMAFGDDLDDSMSERLLERTADTNSSSSTAQFADDFELLSKRETLVFEEDFFRQQQRLGKRGGFFQTYLMAKMQPGSGREPLFHSIYCNWKLV